MFLKLMLKLLWTMLVLFRGEIIQISTTLYECSYNIEDTYLTVNWSSSYYIYNQFVACYLM